MRFTRGGGVLRLIFDGYVPLASQTDVRKLIGGRGEVEKKYSRKGELNEYKFMHAN